MQSQYNHQVKLYKKWTLHLFSHLLLKAQQFISKPWDSTIWVIHKQMVGHALIWPQRETAVQKKKKTSNTEAPRRWNTFQISHFVVRQPWMESFTTHLPRPSSLFWRCYNNRLAQADKFHAFIFVRKTNTLQRYVAQENGDMGCLNECVSPTETGN